MGKLGGAAQFTYDFGISIAQSTVSKVAQLTGATLTLAGAFYTLQQTGEQYAQTLKKNTLLFGGTVQTMKQMQAAQDRIIKGFSYDSVQDQLSAMNDLMAAGINVRKNFGWISKAAKATGQSVAQFSGAIRSAVAGNMSQLVQMGLITERATRQFDKYGSNTIMRQQAVMSFLRKNKAIAAAIANDFETIGEQMFRFRTIISSIFTTIAGKPNDPESWYYAVAHSLKNINDAFARNIQMIRNYAKGIGIVLGYFVRQVGKVILFLGRVAKKVTQTLLGSSDDFVDRMRSLVVWLEFWRQEIVSVLKDAWHWMENFYKEHQTLIKGIGKVLLAYLGLRLAWKVFVEGMFWIHTMILGMKAMRATIMAAGGAWTFFSKAMTVSLFRHQKQRAVLGMFGLTPYKVNTAFLRLGHGAAVAFNAGFSFVKTAVIQTWGAMLTTMRVMWVGFTTGLLTMVKLPFRAISKWFKFSWLLWTRPTMALRMIGNGLKWIIMLIPRMITLIRSAFAAMSTTNPVGWIILAITLVVVLYKKFNWFKKLVWFVIAFVTNSIRIIWNLVNWVFVLLQVAIKWVWKGLKWIWNVLVRVFKWVWNGIKTTWRFLSNTIFAPIKRFFSLVVGWIKNMWKAFMNTAVGRFIDKYIVQPIKWVVDNFGNLINKVANVLGGSANEFAKNQGVYSAGWTGDISTNTVGNTIGGISNSLTAGADSIFGGNKGGYNFSVPNVDLSGLPTAKEKQLTENNIPQKIDQRMYVQQGAIQISVTNTGKGEIDEQKLAKQIRAVLNDMERERGIRNGNTKFS